MVARARSVPARETVVPASLPLLRACAFAAIAVPVSVVGHLAGGGAVPDEATFLLALAMVTVGYRLVLARRERSWAAISVALGCAEFALHLLFDGGSAADTPIATVAGRLPARLPAAMGDMDMSPIGMLHGHVTSGMLMTAGHVASALVLGWVLRHGERVLWSAARRARATAAVLVRLLITVLIPIDCGPAMGTRELGHPIPAADAGRRRFLTTGGALWRGPPAAGRTVV